MIVKTDPLVTWTNYVSLDVEYITVRVLMKQNACRRVVDKFVLLFCEHVQYTRVNLDLLQSNIKSIESPYHWRVAV